MNYLETGLPHTEFYRKKSEFNPPRFIPLCKLSRKYLGLEPMTKREVHHLINRLSEPKRPTIREEIIEIKDVRPKTTGTGRFVGEKKMDSLQIEKMVTRLYNRRTTRDYAFVEDTVEADDIINMTNRSDDSDSDDDAAFTNDNQNTRHVTFSSNSNIIEEALNENIANIRPRSRAPVDLSRNSQTYKSKLDNKQRNPPDYPREVWTRSPMETDDKENVPSLCLRRLGSEGNLNRPTSQNSCHGNMKSENIRLSRNDKRYKYQRSKSESAIKPNSARENDCFSVKFDSKLDSPRQTSTPRYDNMKPRLSFAIPNDQAEEEITSQQNSPRRKFSKADDNKGSRFLLAPGDELLIDKVATYNRGPRLRCRCK